jgi:hypothetical protein
VEDLKGRIKMTPGWFVTVGREEGMRRGKVGSCGLSKPPNGADDALVLPFSIDESRSQLVLVRLGASIDGQAGSIRGSVRRDVPEMDVIFFNKVRCKTGLTEMYFDHVRGDQPLEVSTQEPFDGAHKVNRRILFE